MHKKDSSSYQEAKKKIMAQDKTSPVNHNKNITEDFYSFCPWNKEKDLIQEIKKNINNYPCKY